MVVTNGQMERFTVPVENLRRFVRPGQWVLLDQVGRDRMVRGRVARMKPLVIALRRALRQRLPLGVLR